MSYPVLIYAGLTLVRPRTLAIILAVLLLVHGVVTWPQRGLAQVSRLVLLPVVVVLLLAGLFNQGQFFLLVPVLINAVLLIAFGRTLLWGPPMVETFARLRGRELPDEEVVYCRVVTGLWCLFFAFNGGVTLWLALGATLARWTLYTGVVSYMLIGTLFTAEMVYRYWRFRPEDRDDVGEPERSRPTQGVSAPCPHRLLPGRGRAPTFPDASLRRHRLAVRSHQRSHVARLGRMVPPLRTAARRAHGRDEGPRRRRGDRCVRQRRHDHRGAVGFRRGRRPQHGDARPSAQEAWDPPQPGRGGGAAVPRRALRLHDHGIRASPRRGPPVHVRRALPRAAARRHASHRGLHASAFAGRSGRRTLLP